MNFYQLGFNSEESSTTLPGKTIGIPESSEGRIPECRPTGVSVNHRRYSTRYKGSPIFELQDFLFRKVISSATVNETRKSLLKATGEEVAARHEIPVEIEEEIYALCGALIASEGRLGL